MKKGVFSSAERLSFVKSSKKGGKGDQKEGGLGQGAPVVPEKKNSDG